MLTRACVLSHSPANAGPEGTPYESGCFMFDFHLHDYPHSAPKARFLTTASGRVRFNPNLYSCGKVCLSLLGTWSGPGWQPKKSTLLQVLVSIQGLILVPDPYYNEPGYEPGTRKKQSEDYNTRIRQYTVEHAIYDAIREVLQASTDKPNPYPEFQEIIFEHFRHRSGSVLRQLEKWQARDKKIAPSITRARAVLEIVATHGTLPEAQAAYAASPASIAPRPDPGPSRQAHEDFPLSFSPNYPSLSEFKAALLPMMTSRNETPSMSSSSAAAALASSTAGTLAPMPPPSNTTQPLPPFAFSTRAPSVPFSTTSTATALGDAWSGALSSSFGPSGPGPRRQREASRKTSQGLLANPYDRRSSRYSSPGAFGFGLAAQTDSTASTSPFAFAGPPTGPQGTGNPVIPPGSWANQIAAPKAPPALPAGASRDVWSPSAPSPTKGPVTRVTGALSALTKRTRRGSNAPLALASSTSPGNGKVDPRDVIVID
jgi:ubiquitin-protein ligase